MQPAARANCRAPGKGTHLRLAWPARGRSRGCTARGQPAAPAEEDALSKRAIDMGRLLRGIRLHLRKQLLEVQPCPQGVKIRVCLQAGHARLTLGDRFVQQLDGPTGMRLPQNAIVPHRTRTPAAAVMRRPP